jgi:hypothetical protein
VTRSDAPVEANETVAELGTCTKRYVIHCGPCISHGDESQLQLLQRACQLPVNPPCEATESVIHMRVESNTGE